MCTLPTYSVQLRISRHEHNWLIGGSHYMKTCFLGQILLMPGCQQALAAMSLHVGACKGNSSDTEVHRPLTWIGLCSDDQPVFLLKWIKKSARVPFPWNRGSGIICIINGSVYLIPRLQLACECTFNCMLLAAMTSLRLNCSPVYLVILTDPAVELLD